MQKLTAAANDALARLNIPPQKTPNARPLANDSRKAGRGATRALQDHQQRRDDRRPRPEREDVVPEARDVPAAQDL